MTTTRTVDTAEAVLEEIHAERRRQVEVEGWDAEHDDTEHYDGDLAVGAACYALSASDEPDTAATGREMWPWETEWWKPTTKRRNLIKAAALIVAEIERLDRVSEAKGAP